MAEKVTKSAKLIDRRYIVPFILIASLFFLWGFSRSILDVLNKHFQDVMSLSKTESALIQVAVYSAYFLMALPAGLFIMRKGYRSGVVLGLMLFAAGAFMFIPGEWCGSFGLFLTALFVLGCGLAFLETAANPYAAGLGDPRTSASRLNLAQSLNGMGCIFGPLIFGQILFGGEDGGAGEHLALPYGILGVIVLVAALVFTRVKLPEIKSDDSVAPSADRCMVRSLWKRRTFVFGLAAIFCYEISEIAINSFFINFVTDDGNIAASTASKMLSICGLGLFFAGRLIGSRVMSRVRAEKVLLICAACTVACTLVVTFAGGMVAIVALCACYLFESIMFPTIFALSLSGLGGLTKLGSSFLMMSPIGGAIGTLTMGYIADRAGMSLSFLVPMAGYAVVLLFAMYYTRHKD
ncbi:MFS transporter [Muribaculaceae bacterium Isolate-002 (NCI)]|nr:MFS transporter [Muribaculaceae bacterium Isolate-002 (NCI)]